MTRRVELTPRLMPAPVAATYLGVSESTLRTLAIPRKALGSKRVYDRADLDAFADSLAYENGVARPAAQEQPLRPKAWARG